MSEMEQIETLGRTLSDMGEMRDKERRHKESLEQSEKHWAANPENLAGSIFNQMVQEKDPAKRSEYQKQLNNILDAAKANKELFDRLKGRQAEDTDFVSQGPKPTRVDVKPLFKGVDPLPQPPGFLDIGGSYEQRKLKWLKENYATLRENWNHSPFKQWHPDALDDVVDSALLYSKNAKIEDPDESFSTPIQVPVEYGSYGGKGKSVPRPAPKGGSMFAQTKKVAPKSEAPKSEAPKKEAPKKEDDKDEDDGPSLVEKVFATFSKAVTPASAEKAGPKKLSAETEKKVLQFMKQNKIKNRDKAVSILAEKGLIK